MRIVDRGWRFGPGLLRSAWVLILSAGCLCRADGPDESTRLDCGVNALYVLMRLEGRPVTLDRLLSALPARHQEGYSMAELTDAAGSLGLDLEGVAFAKGDRPPARPAIAFLKDEKGGHFTVLRPVGTIGTMVQVIDPPLVPWIADYDRVLASKPWMGRILVARETWYGGSFIAVLIASVLLMLSFLAIRRRASRASLT